MLLTRRAVLGGTVMMAGLVRKPALADDEPGAFRPLSAIQQVSPPQALPELEFAGLDGKRRRLAAFRGQPVVLNFWATWCAPCVKELPELDRLAVVGGITVLAVSADHGGADAVRPFLAAHKLPHLTVLLDPESEAVHLLGLLGFPTTLILDAQARLRGRLEGPAAWAGAAETVRHLTA